MEKKSLLIVGAGVSGLMAAYLLCDKFKVTILEAQPRIGGRIHSLYVNNTVIESGPEFIHGNAGLSLDLLKKADIKIVKTGGKIYRHRNGGLIPQEENIEGWDDLLQQMKGVEIDTTVDKFLDQNYPASDNELRREVLNYAAGFDLADGSMASIKKLYVEWSNEDEGDHCIPGGYSLLTDWLRHILETKAVKIELRQPVLEVNWTNNKIVTKTVPGKEFNTDNILMTVPVALLGITAGKGSINFIPSIEPYRMAARKIGFGAVIKVVICFSKSFWKDDTGFILSNETFRTWWTSFPERDFRLTGWVGGPPAKALSNESDHELLDKALQSLSNIFGLPVNILEDLVVESFIFNWQKNDFTPGGYSFSTVASEAARSILNTPIAKKIYFAGEGLYDGTKPGTVEAALQSATKTAEKILGDL